MVVVLATKSERVFSQLGFHFVTGRSWAPNFNRFGALPLIFGTLVTSAIAIVLAVPVSVGLAVLLNESHSGVIRNGLAVFVDLLAAVPSVVYGLWGIFVMAPVFDHHVEPFLTSTIGRVPLIGALFRGAKYCQVHDPVHAGHCLKFGYNTNGGDIFTAGVILAVMVLPIVTAVTREVIAVVPREQREAAKALGATRYETIRMAVLPYARSGIVGASMLGLGRALGETIAVLMLIGNNVTYIGASLFKPAETIPAAIANEFREASSGGLHRSALLALALILMVIALLMATLSRLVVRRTANIITGDPGAVAPMVAQGEA